MCWPESGQPQSKGLLRKRQNSRWGQMSDNKQLGGGRISSGTWLEGMRSTVARRHGGRWSRATGACSHLARDQEAERPELEVGGLQVTRLALRQPTFSSYRSPSKETSSLAKQHH